MPRRSALLAAGQTARASSGGGGGTVLPIFSDSFPNFNKWNSLQWSSGGTIRNSGGSSYTANNEYSCTRVAIDGRTDVLRFELRDGDIPFSGTERSEIGEPFASSVGDMEITPGTERWITWDMKFDSTWPVASGSSGWNIIWQWHSNANISGVPLVLNIDSSDVIRIEATDPSHLVHTNVQSVVRNTWQRWIVHVKFSDNPAVGFVEVWVDGTNVVPKEFRRTMADGDSGSYFKTGIYRDPVNTATAIRYLDNLSFWDQLPPELGGGGGGGGGGSTTISSVGSLVYASGTTANDTLAVSPSAVGNLLALSTSINASGTTVTGVSGGGVTTWTRVAGPYLGPSHSRNHDIWIGKVTTAGSSTITLTTSASVSGVRVDRGIQEFSSSLGSASTWTADGSGGTGTGAASTTIQFPTLTPTAAGRLYFGYSVTGGAPSAVTSGYTLLADSNGNPWIYNTNVSGAQSPTVTQTSGAWSDIAALIQVA